jgi:hypothetical protein
MPAEDIQSWSTTAASNANADTGINWAEGQPRASVNNSARAMMAAHAKDRNLRNGSITTGGTANVQTFSSGVGYSGTVPTGLCVKLKAGFTNTGAMTLSMDAITAQAVVDMAGNPAAANAFIAGRYVDLLFDGTLWRLIGGTGISGGGGGSSGALTTTNVECGRLEYVGATQLKFAPFKGDMMKINGTLYNIPAAGIVGRTSPPRCCITSMRSTMPGSSPPTTAPRPHRM